MSPFSIYKNTIIALNSKSTIEAKYMFFSVCLLLFYLIGPFQVRISVTLNAVYFIFQFLSVCVMLSLQNPKAFIMKIFCEVLINMNQLPISMKVLKVLSHISCLKDGDKILIFQVLIDVMDSKLANATEQNNFLKAVSI